ncbi:hypothetical protein L596_029758 [Steinernema carpocapsae]|uniref:Uncharacterized protein n=1 Tax=Steinernema carpocapsae TaxID=34508 RepID=A0A4U5LQQ6_STECR|nr:hypothetical protein L596_029758 [Steinernema carpocapsae]
MVNASFKPYIFQFCLASLVFVLYKWIFVTSSSQRHSCPIVQPNSDPFFTKQESLFTTRCFNKNSLNWTQFAKRVLRTPEVWKDVKKAKKQNNGVDKFVPDFKRLLPKIFENSQRDVIRIIELGSFKGHSTVEMAKECQELAKESDKKCQIVAVDTWLASPEHYESEGKEMSHE